MISSPSRLSWGVLLCMTLLVAAVPGTDCLPSPFQPRVPELSFGISIGQPAGDVGLDTENAVTIRWSDFGLPSAGATVSIWVDPDDQDDNGNEIFLAQRQAGDDLDADQLEWTGLDADDQPVAPGAYRMIAVLDDGAGQTDRAVAGGRVFLPFRWQSPAIDIDLPANGSIRLEWAEDIEAGTLAFLLLDVDEDMTSGNEITLFDSQGAENDLGGQLDFAGADFDGNPVPAGTYSLYALVLCPDLEASLIYEALGSITISEDAQPGQFAQWATPRGITPARLIPADPASKDS